ncbi:unnamed protein product [Amaranthus hypochondriacus]
MKMNMSSLAVLVLLVFNASLFITCEAALFSFPKPKITFTGVLPNGQNLEKHIEKAKKFEEAIENAGEIAVDLYNNYQENHPTKADIKQIQLYCPLFLQILRDTNQSINMNTRKAAYFSYKKYCTN